MRSDAFPLGSDRPTPFGRWMAHHRRRKGWSQQHIAVMLTNRIGPVINLGRICELEKGQIVPSNIKKVRADVLIQTLHEILDLGGPPPPTPTLAPHKPAGPAAPAVAV